MAWSVDVPALRIVSLQDFPAEDDVLGVVFPPGNSWAPGCPGEREMKAYQQEYQREHPDLRPMTRCFRQQPISQVVRRRFATT